MFKYSLCNKPLLSSGHSRIWLGVYCTLFCIFAEAWTLPGEFSGFASQALVSTSDNNFFGDTDDDISVEYTELGLVYRAEVEKWQFSSQLMSRVAGDTDDGSPRVDYIFLGREFWQTDQLNSGLRVGRLKKLFGFYNDTRDVAFTRPSIWLPQSVYFDRIRNTTMRQDGVQWYGEYNLKGVDNIQWHLAYGRNTMDDEELDDILAVISSTVDESEANFTLNGRLIYDHNVGDWRLGVSYSLLSIDITFLGLGFDGEVEQEKLAISFEMDRGSWAFTSELVPSEFRFNSLLSETSVFGYAYYVQFLLRQSPSWEWLIRWDSHVLNRHDPNGDHFEAFVAGTAAAQPHYVQYAKDLTLGASWHLSPSLLMRFEWHHVEGAGWLSARENPDAFSVSKYWDLFGIQISYRF